ncbi:hypothetical protein ColTof3_03214 [Colletotrichum tofieldiae]|nr:hypothetical protein ColTof3_03214 [Colletotrichum tofieldiae]GKT82457.1 hypothetical protein Ct61P_00307 [Colletotrichum tofieldiae]
MQEFLEVVESGSFDLNCWSSIVRTITRKNNRPTDQGPEEISRDIDDGFEPKPSEWLIEHHTANLDSSASSEQDRNPTDPRYTMNLQVLPWYEELFYLLLEYITAVVQSLG